MHMMDTKSVRPRRSSRKRSKEVVTPLKVQRPLAKQAKEPFVRPSNYVRSYSKPPFADKALDSGEGSWSLGSSRQTERGVWGPGERVSLAENLKAALASEKPEHVLRNALLLDNAFPKGYTSLSQKLDEEFEDQVPPKTDANFRPSVLAPEFTKLLTSSPSPTETSQHAPRELFSKWSGEEGQLTCQELDYELDLHDICTPQIHSRVPDIHMSRDIPQVIGDQSVPAASGYAPLAAEIPAAQSPTIPFLPNSWGPQRRVPVGNPRLRALDEGVQPVDSSRHIEDWLNYQELPEPHSFPLVSPTPLSLYANHF